MNDVEIAVRWFYEGKVIDMTQAQVTKALNYGLLLSNEVKRLRNLLEHRTSAT